MNVENAVEKETLTFEKQLEHKIEEAAVAAIKPLKSELKSERETMKEEMSTMRKELEDARRSLQAIESSMTEYECSFCGKYVLSAHGGYYRGEYGVICGPKCLDKYQAVKKKLLGEK